ncbi:ABC transporter permease [Pseudoduganella violaceinigra]|uniref:ABC transporter permease n=1 Tax=Pseudoduganella violaceinigra TaxID=246602 RepID=UPI00040BE252|nr:ABC transporter permease [Pseudoduganella violaceinigra]
MLKNYMRMAWNVARRRKLFTAINLACIVITLVVLLVVTALLQEAFYPVGVEHRSSRFVEVYVIDATNTKGTSTSTSPLGYKVIEKYLKPLSGLEAVSAVSGVQTASVIKDGNIIAVQTRHVDAEYWRILDFKLLAGRLPSTDDDEQGRMVTVLARPMALKLFGDAAPLGRKVESGGQTFTVIGVVEPALALNAYADMWMPITTYPSTQYQHQMTGNFFALLLARSPDDLPGIRQRVAQVAKEIRFKDKLEYDIVYLWADSKLDIFARTLTSSRELDSGSGKVVAVIAGVMILFMLLPALNLVNLNMGRILERSTEIGVRKAFGASNGQLVMQLVLENVLLCLAGGLFALLGAQGVLLWLEAYGPMPYLKVSLNLAVFGWGLLLTIVFGVLSGVIPAWKMARLDPVYALKGAA